MWKAIKELERRDKSGAINLNFLYKNKAHNIYVMDNHRAALWCWLQSLNNAGQYGLIHIDAHYDSAVPDDEELSNLPELSELSLNQFLDVETKNPKKGERAIDCGNYMGIFFSKYSQLLLEKQFYISTQKLIGSMPKIFSWRESDEIDLYSLPSFIKKLNDDSNTKWIINLDLDFIFKEGQRYLSSEFLAELSQAIEALIVSDRVEVLTVCLSPEYCSRTDGWKASEDVCIEFFSYMKILNIDFVLPQ